MIRAVVISRKNDHLRRARIARSMPESVNWSFIDAVDGHEPGGIEEKYHALYPKRFWGSSRMQPGAFGCFVSHVKAWESCADSGQSLMVFEDDIVLGEWTPGLLRTCEALHSDLLFLNRGMVNWYRFFRVCNACRIIPSPVIRERIATRALWYMRDAAPAGALVVHPLQPIVSRIVGDNLVPPNQEAPGGYCYLVSPNGAKKLLILSDNHGAIMGVDWFMVASALQGKTLSPGRRWKLPAQALSYLIGTERLDADVAEYWVADSVDNDVGGSAIRHDVLVDIEEYRRSLTAADASSSSGID